MIRNKIMMMSKIMRHQGDRVLRGPRKEEEKEKKEEEAESVWEEPWLLEQEV